ncbi:M56 family metallopeptidase [Flavobacterium johnsoniae]|uniref:Peptidase M56, BlaR1 n=1 Tax=Flavobacterium johnsoniae (strain ATCC 17061 / DSM 2064 / JCM 8514 / BCRC 14874 / CCUG 350202 / NBRC 14942 / NCIMB 11054 / UW101) TaxID=376686 RepID=A5FEY9_FLAJ1|nr:M56 family metallopeptidase [Flavobacterium johnsoniae]ABQ06227.1 peptidase M56, BlaR1 [Flavobacterium johnsoniae UW101]OXE98302.1 peptidase M56, BlaR1 [Flavobacterium johnsoniae UW101]WQG81973.1 M56 family metallopeptidase [Flavobacterium johnsoniae UW101]SHK69394.1 Signal transducer regulating beta-lactamase production, contains metallopeptidase domain [Flavobacterium johnsoniae]
MIPYILYTALILSACFLFYKLLLQKETFFHLNRYVLLFCMVLAFTLPLIPVPQQLSFRKNAVEQSIEAAKIPTGTAAAQTSKEKSIESVPVEETKQVINVDVLLQGIIYLYWFGVVIFGLNFLMQAVILLFKSYSGSVIQDGKFRIVEITGDKAPCSFGNNIFINPEKYEWETYNQILLHEKIHIEQKHTIDLLLAEVVLVFQWFNPFAWQWRKALETNLEFLTDDQMLQHDTVERESYQFSLLKVAAPQFPLSLTTNYNQSLLKKRIIMMNSKKSNVHTTWKYFFLVPLMVLFACLFNQPAAQSQPLNSKGESKQNVIVEDEMKTDGNWFAVIKGDSIEISFKSDEHSNSSHTFQLRELSSIPRDKQGDFTLTREVGTMNFNGKFEGNKGMGTYKFTANKDYSTAMNKEGLDIKKDNDLMVFFLINIKVSYVQMLKKNGFNNLDNQVIPLAALDVNEAYITSIKKAIPDIDLENLVPFKSLGIDKAFIEEIRSSGYKNVSPSNIIALKSQGIDGKYINDFRSSGKKSDNVENNNRNNNDDNDDDDIIAFKALNVDKAFIDSFKALGYNNLSNGDLIGFKSLNVTPEYVKSFQNAGYKNISAENLMALKSQNISPDLVKEYKSLGFDNLDLEEIVGAKAIGTTPAYIKSMRAKGHDFKSLEKYIALKSLANN